MSLAAEESTMCFSYVYIETIVVYKVCRRPVKQFRVITSTCAPIRSCRLCKNKKKKREEEEEKRNYMPCKDILEPWPNIGWFIRRLLSRRRRTRSQGDPLNALLSQDVTQGHKSDVFWIACSEMLRGTKRATCYRLVSWWSQIKNLAFNALKSLHTDGIENDVYNICCLTVKAGNIWKNTNDTWKSFRRQLCGFEVTYSAFIYVILRWPWNVLCIFYHIFL